jgi:replication factor C subunit 2/4
MRSSMLALAPPYAVLRAAGYWQDIHHSSSGETIIRVSAQLSATGYLLNAASFSPENFRDRVLELNASDDRGIAIVREKIKNFARQTPRAQTIASDGKAYPCPPYKIIILDEADSMTQDAQGALRRIMETYARITRFCLVCNYVTRFVSFS